MQNPTNQTQTIEQQEKEGKDYALFIIDEKKKIDKGELFVAESWWQEQILNVLKEKLLNSIGNTLKHLAIEKMVEFSGWLLEKLEDNIFELYKNASVKERDLFKNKLKEVFPSSSLLKKLNNYGN